MLSASRHEWSFAFALFTVVACLWFFPLLKGDQLGQSYTNFAYVPFHASLSADPLPARALAADAALAFHPWLTVARRELRAGHLPLWNPYEYGGTTLAGNMQSGLFFPPTWLLLALPLGYAIGLVAVLKLVIAGVGAYALAREMEASRTGALLAGTVYMLSAPLMAWVNWPPHSGVFALFPWLLLATARVQADQSARPVALLATVSGLTVLAGHPESALLSVSAAAVFLVGLVISDARRVRPLMAWAAGLALGLAAAAVAVLPFLEALRPSVTRGGFFHATELPFSHGLAFAMPQLFGDGEPDLYGVGYFNEDIAIWFGLPALVLAIAAGVRLRRQPHVLALGLMCALALAAMFGIPPVSWIFEHVKPWADTTLGARIGFVVALAGAVGAGLGFTELTDRPMRGRAVAAIAAAVALVAGTGYLLAVQRGVLAAPVSVRHDALRTGAITLVGCGLLLLVIGRIPQVLALVLAAGAVVASLSGLRDLNPILPPARAYPAQPEALRAIPDRSARVGVIPVATHPRLIPPNLLAVYGLASSEGYDFPLSRRWSTFQSEVLGFRSLRPEYAHASEPPTRQSLYGQRLFSTRYYVAQPGSKPPFESFEPVYTGDDATIFRDPGALPRAFVVQAIRPASDAEALGAMRRGEIDLRREALVPEGAAKPASGGGPPRATRVEQVANHHLRVTIGPGPAGWLVLGNAFSPEWKAEAEGRDLDVQPTDYAAMGVPVSASTRTVDFRLDRGSLWLGAAISLAAWVLIGILGTWGRPASAPRGASRRAASAPSSRRS